jgi:dGTPase
MLKTREMMESDEAAGLARYAQRVTESAGRRYAEPLHPYRTAFQRDRSRIIHSRAFRRLEYKTQVFLNGTGDHLRTRLTHTIEVASVSRTIACALGLNEDLAEAIALAHDLGHAPFGHSGEKKLNELMMGEGGFEHNVQSLRVVELIETVYPNFVGLNLSYEVLEGLRKHDGGYSREACGGQAAETFPRASLEAQVANIADEITYYSHDLDDGLVHALITEEQLLDIPVWRRCADHVRQNFPSLEGRLFVSYVVRTLIDHQVADLVIATHERVEAAGVTCADDVRRYPKSLAGYSDELRAANQELRVFLYENLYFHPDVAGPNRRGMEIIGEVFTRYLDDPRLLGDATVERLDEHGLHRTVCDYVSGMTDRYITEEHARMSGGRDAGKD